MRFSKEEEDELVNILCKNRKKKELARFIVESVSSEVLWNFSKNNLNTEFYKRHTEGYKDV